MIQKTAAFITLGCKINQYETEAIREDVLDIGYDEVGPNDPADVYVVNTCSVTAMAGSKSRKAILRAARKNPEARIVVVGCSSPEEKAKIRQIPQVSFLAGNEEKGMVASFLDGNWKPGEPIPDGEGVLNLSISRYRGRTRATLKVQDGCNNFCSFCIIPHLRGTSRSRPADAVVDEVRRLVDAGFVELVVSGIHLQDYGLDLSPRLNLVDLLRRVAEVEGLERIRLSSLGTQAFTPEFLDLMEHPVFCPHWHIPIQAGSEEVLEIMRRGYTLERFCDVMAELRERFESPAITTDVIVGHPGESDEIFERSAEVYRELEFAKMHVFPFSFREGTLSEKLWREDPIDPVEIRRRATLVGEIERAAGERYRAGFVGRDLDVLVEGPSKGRDGFLEGLTERYVRVAFPAPSAQSVDRFPGTIHRVRTLSAEGDLLLGEWAESPIGSGLAG
ncbi:MAG: tRNA (N(6)-L-threonylcarbamoyladenosine(37)-C(2))-methylthiotransferase MtaB [Planctomycetota bacterium]